MLEDREQQVSRERAAVERSTPGADPGPVSMLQRSARLGGGARAEAEAEAEAEARATRISALGAELRNLALGRGVAEQEVADMQEQLATVEGRLAMLRDHEAELQRQAAALGAAA